MCDDGDDGDDDGDDNCNALDDGGVEKKETTRFCDTFCVEASEQQRRAYGSLNCGLCSLTHRRTSVSVTPGLVLHNTPTPVSREHTHA